MSQTSHELLDLKGPYKEDYRSAKEIRAGITFNHVQVQPLRCYIDCSSFHFTSDTVYQILFPLSNVKGQFLFAAYWLSFLVTREQKWLQEI